MATVTTDIIRYRPPEVLHWLELGARDLKQDAARHGRSVVRREGERTIQKDVVQAAQALYDLGKGTFADVVHRSVQAIEYALLDDSLEIRETARTRTIPYSRIKRIEWKTGDRATVVLDQGSISIKPLAHLVAGAIKVPVGWNRNGMDVPYDLLIDELAARAGVDIERH